MGRQYGTRTTSHASKTVALLTSIWVATGFLVLPAVFHWHATAPHYGADRHFRLAALYGLIAGIAFRIYRVESRILSKSKAFGLIFLIFLLTCVVENFHSHFVDRGPSYFGFISNVQWQFNTHKSVIDMNPGAVPHSYRFLPNAFVRWLEIWHLQFEPSRDLYRMLFGFLLFYAIYRYARLYTSFSGAVLAILLTAIIYPITFENYAGQLTDPMAHLAFVLALYFLATDNFPFFLTTLLVGSLAKETVLAMAGYYVLFHRRGPNYLAKAIALAVLCPLTYLGVHLYVLSQSHGLGVSFSKLITDRTWFAILATNLKDPQWPIFVPLTGLALVPFLFLAWRSTPKSLKYVAVYVLAVVFLSNLLFSWLAETRNLMPAVFVLAVISARFITEELTRTGTTSVVEQRSSVEFVEETAVF